ncbi:MAG: protease modulator HflC [Oscillospiraceae bacterium]|nr:protease modulator HflC [Oscillospiraceae bacterium]
MNDFLDFLGLGGSDKNKRPPYSQGEPQGPGGPQDYSEGTAIMVKALKRGFAAVAVLIAVLILAGQCIVLTRADEYMVIQQFGEIRQVTHEPGISFKLPFIQTSRSVTKRVKKYDIPVSDVITQDKRSMVVDSFILWKVTDPTKFIQSVNGVVAAAEMHIETISYNSMQNVISLLPQSEIISGRDTLALRIMDNIGGSLDQFGIALIAIETKHLDLPDANKQAVYDRMISERNNIAATYHAEGAEEARMIHNNTDMQVSIMLSRAEAIAARTIADGERRYMEILSEAYNDPERADFYAFVRALDASRKALQGGDTTLILSGDSPIARVFYDIG